MHKIEHPQVKRRFAAYPQRISTKLMFLRQLIFETASVTEGVGRLEETTKWGEPSYLSKIGSTIRIDWKKKCPGYYAMYFNCNTKLVDTFKEVYGDVLRFESNRAIVFHEDDVIAVNELKHCIELALTYHKIKHLPLLGA